MSRLMIQVLIGGSEQFKRVIDRDYNLTVGSLPPTEQFGSGLSKIPSITIDDDTIPPVSTLAQFVGGGLWLVTTGWGKPGPKDENRLAGQLDKASDGKLTFCFKSKRDGDVVINLEVVA